MLRFFGSSYRLITILSLLILVSCGRKDDSESPSGIKSTSPSSSISNPNPSAISGASSNGTPAAAPGAAPVAAPAPQQKMIVRNGDLEIESNDHELTMRRISTVVTGNGGYVSNESTRRTSEDRIYSDLTVRIPVEHFDSVLVAIKKTGSDVISENISAADQTKLYYDLDAHLSAKKSEMAQMQDLMKSAKTMADIIVIRKEIIDLQSELDMLEGTTKQIANDVAYSTLHISISSRVSNAFFPKIGAAFAQGLSTFTDVLAETITFVISKSPVFAAMLGFIYLVMWMSRRGRRKEREKSLV